MDLSVTLLVSLALFIAASDARPKKHHHSTDAFDDLFGDDEFLLDEDDEEMPPSRHRHALRYVDERLSNIRRPANPQDYLGLPISFFINSGQRPHFKLEEITTQIRLDIFSAGRIAFKGVNLIDSPANIIAFKFRPRTNTSFDSAALKLQLETDRATSAIRTVHLDAIHNICPQQGLSKYVCPATSEDYDALFVGAIPIPYFEEIEMTKEEVGSMHLWVETEKEEHLLDARFFVVKDRKEFDRV